MKKPDEPTLQALNHRMNDLCPPQSPDGICAAVYQPVDYVGSLDNVHAAEREVLTTESLYQGFAGQLNALVLKCFIADRNGSPHAICAEAWQRCVAIDRTLFEKPIV